MDAVFSQFKSASIGTTGTVRVAVSSRDVTFKHSAAVAGGVICEPFRHCLLGGRFFTTVNKELGEKAYRRTEAIFLSECYGLLESVFRLGSPLWLRLEENSQCQPPSRVVNDVERFSSVMATQ